MSKDDLPGIGSRGEDRLAEPLPTMPSSSIKELLDGSIGNYCFDAPEDLKAIFQVFEVTVLRNGGIVPRVRLIVVEQGHPLSKQVPVNTEINVSDLARTNPEFRGESSGASRSLWGYLKCLARFTAYRERVFQSWLKTRESPSGSSFIVEYCGHA